MGKKVGGLAGLFKRRLGEGLNGEDLFRDEKGFDWKLAKTVLRELRIGWIYQLGA